MDEQIDMSYLKANFGDDETFIKEMLDTIRKELPERMDQLGRAVDNNNSEQVHQVAHSIKSSIEMLGLKKLLDKIKTLEEAGKDNENMLPYKDVITQANALYLKAEKDMDKILS